MDKHLEIFESEASDLLTEIEQVILLVEDNPKDADAINRLFRAVHTLKGSGGMFSLTELVDLAHDLEAVLDRIRSNELTINTALINIILVSRDMLQELIANIGKANTDDIKIRLSALREGLQKFLVPKTGAKEEIASASQTALHMELALYRITFYPNENLYQTGMDPALLLKELQGLGRSAETVYTDKIPPLSGFDPSKCYLGWGIILETDKGIDAIRDIFIFVEDGSLIDITRLDVLPDEAAPRLGDILVARGDIARDEIEKFAISKIGQRLVETNTVSSEKIASSLEEQNAVARHQEALKRECIRVPSDKLDALINLVGELVTNQARIDQIAADINNPTLSAPVEDINRLTAELRDIVLNVRMVQIGTLFSKYKRLVRDLSRDLGKELDLVTEGEETELDKTVIDRLGEQLVHIIRNSVDHGIEPPDERERIGKPRRGTILLKAGHRGAHVVINVQDDGKGLNTEAIRAQAVKRGIVSADQELTEKEVFRLIFAPGLSTATKVTDVSGRGVGMDSVLKGVESLRGTIDIQSAEGQGTTFELALPLTLAIIDGLLVESGKQRYVIPLCVVEECLELSGETLTVEGARNLIEIRGGTIPILHLYSLFGGYSGGESREAVIVGVGDASVAIGVDSIIGNHQTVIKSLGELGRASPCISGATIMGDGNVALILDAAEIVKLATNEEKAKVA
ncbi:MAG: chemotaxis protein CheA [Alphaproteobacteria bacterium]|nr:chemotaxis protein CheA [Alphaproteobacteria bacterium]